MYCIIERGDIMDTAIICALIGTMSAIIVAIITSYYSKKRELQFEERKLKQKYYIDYILALSENMNNLDDETYTIKENNSFNLIVLVGSANVVNALYELKDLVIKYLKKESIANYEAKYTELLTALLKEMRIDLYGNSKKVNSNIKEIYFLSGVLKKEK